MEYDPMDSGSKKRSCGGDGNADDEQRRSSRKHEQHERRWKMEEEKEKAMLLMLSSKAGHQVCDFCGVDIHLEDVFQHMQHHVGDYAFKCPNQYCKHVFLTKFSENFYAHIRMDHKLRGNCWFSAGRMKDDEMELKRCDICGTGYPTIDKFELHLVSHETGEKLFPCPVPRCGEMFSVRQGVEVHLCQSHLVKKMEFTVPEVQKGSEILLCSSCQNPRQFPSRLALEEHKFTVHGIGNKFNCEEGACGFYCFSSGGLKQHRHNEHQGAGLAGGSSKMILECRFCEEEFRYKENLDEHEKVKHQ